MSSAGRRTAPFHTSELIRLVLCSCGFFRLLPDLEQAWDRMLDHLAEDHFTWHQATAEILRVGDP